MQLIRGWQNIRPQHRHGVVTIGNFDGVHLGHQRIIQLAQRWAEEKNAPLLAVVFEPQPQEYLYPQTAPIRLTPLRDKIELLRHYGLPNMMCLRFNQALASWSPETFVQHILVEKLAVTAIVVGEDFCFGRQRQGNVALLKQLGVKWGFVVEALPAIVVAEERVSSTRIRLALEQRELAQVKSLLGRHYCIQGRVVHGDHYGRLLGFPTANIHLLREKVPLTGVFAVRVHGLTQVYNGVANLGFRPTVDGKQLRLEVHLLDFCADIYGAHLQIEFLHALRSEQKFASLDELTLQISKDVAVARDYFVMEKK